jgi:hypothetical protein
MPISFNHDRRFGSQLLLRLTAADRATIHFTHCTPAEHLMDVRIPVVVSEEGEGALAAAMKTWAAGPRRTPEGVELLVSSDQLGEHEWRDSPELLEELALLVEELAAATGQAPELC